MTGFGGKPEAFDRNNAAKGDAEIINPQCLAGSAIGKECCDVNTHVARNPRIDTPDAALDFADDTPRCDQQNQQQKSADEEQAVFGEGRQEFGQQYDDERTDQLMCFWITDFNANLTKPGGMRRMYVCIDPVSGAIIPQSIEQENVG